MHGKFVGNTNITIYFQFECTSNLYAKCLAEHLNSEYRSTVRSIREAEYDQGYCDGKAKRKYKLDFQRSLEAY